MRYGAIELGGTKIVCAVGDENGKVFEQIRIPTTTPEETMAQVLEYLSDKNLDALGIASFGPINLNKNSEKYGTLMDGAKYEWRDYNLIEALAPLGIPMEMDTDVAGSMLGEAFLGAAKNIENALYLTIGTGIGAGIMVNGKMVHGMLHPEAGHVLLNRAKNDTAKSVCRFHDNCAEGLASGPAIKEHWGIAAEELLDRDEVWELEADYIAQALCNYIMTVSPEKIILGGGVMHVEKLFPLIRKKTLEYVNKYVDTALLDDIDNYIVPAGLLDDQGIVGCLYLAGEAYKNKQEA